jgi:hypothetical protein
MTLKEINKAFDKLSHFAGAKERVAEIHGVHKETIRLILSGKIKADEDRLFQIHQAIKQSASEHTKKVNDINVQLQAPLH